MATASAAHPDHRAQVVLSARNRPDFDDVPEVVRTRLEFIWLDRAEQAINAALTGEHLIAEAKRDRSIVGRAGAVLSSSLVELFVE
jgi:hypothetical protein